MPQLPIFFLNYKEAPKIQKDKLEDAKRCTRHKTAPAKVLATSAKTLFVQQACSQDLALQKALVFPTKS